MANNLDFELGHELLIVGKYRTYYKAPLRIKSLMKIYFTYVACLPIEYRFHFVLSETGPQKVRCTLNIKNPTQVSYCYEPMSMYRSPNFRVPILWGFIEPGEEAPVSCKHLSSISCTSV